jgi:hypothetical protein
MAAVDSSTLVAFFHGAEGADIDRFDAELLAANVSLSPAVIVEVLSHPHLSEAHIDLVSRIPVLEPTPGFWLRAAETRREVLSRGLRARLADTLIAQSCIDHDVALITRDADFRQFAKYCGLKLA